MSFFGGYLVVPVWKSKYMDDFDTVVNVYGEWLSCWKCGRFLNNLHYERSMPARLDDPGHHYWADFARFADAVGWFAGFDAAGEWSVLCPVHNSERLSLLDDVCYGHRPIILKSDDATIRERKIVTWLAGRDVNEADRFGRTPLMLIGDNEIFIAELLIELGANINAQNSWGNTPLNYAVQKPAKTKKVVRYLLENGADVNLNAPIIYAERQFVPLLVEYGADVNQVNEKGHFSLAVSALQQHHLSLTYLVEHGADVNYVNRMGSVRWRVPCGKEIMRRLLICWKKVLILIDTLIWETIQPKC